MTSLNPSYDTHKRHDEEDLLNKLILQTDLSDQNRVQIVQDAITLVEQTRKQGRPGLMEVFLGEYGLSTQEGVALMRLAEALLRVPDAVTLDALIEDKIAPSDWSCHLGQSSSPLVNASTWGLFLSGKVLVGGKSSITSTLHKTVRRLGEPLIRKAVSHAMREMGHQFVLGATIDRAMIRAQKREKQGYTYSYDMLGEAAMTQDDADRYAQAYARAIGSIATACSSANVIANPGISIKLSALHPRYQVAQSERVLQELVPVVRTLARQAATAGMGFNIDAEEADRLTLSMAVIERVLEDEALKNWDGFGLAVQAYGRRAGAVIDGIYDLAQCHQRRLMVRLVKGAYWDTEVKHAQVEGLDGFPVFTRKAATDVSYLAHTRRLLTMRDWIYPQFATHNAHSVSAILHMAKGMGADGFEFQRLHGMGAQLHDLVRAQAGTPCRIYAPVGAHRDLLAYLIRRLLENGANSSFVNRIGDTQIPPEDVVRCPFKELAQDPKPSEPRFVRGSELFLPVRKNASGFDLFDVTALARIDRVRAPVSDLKTGPIIAGTVESGKAEANINPATNERIGTITHASAGDVETALCAAHPWDVSAAERIAVLNRAADSYEENFGEAFSLLTVEAGKTLPDCVAELREAVDFLRYYAAQVRKLERTARGLFTCISPWNFPLAIFTGQIAAALSAGNAVLAKPAETTPAIATWAVQRLHQAGVPRSALQLLPGAGAEIGHALTNDLRIAGVAFTGSTQTARRIQKTMAQGCEPGTPLIAETGGLNAMIVDSTALPEQAIRDILASAFQSAGQRCSALRCLYVQRDIASAVTQMLRGAMDQLSVGNPWHLATDIGPVITARARDQISAYVKRAEQEGRLLHRVDKPNEGTFVAPSLIAVQGIADLKQEIFGPVLHLATFKACDLDQVIDDINATGYGLTFGLHTRIDQRVQHVTDRVKVGNIYANRNQIGAIVGSQPFGGEGLSGTGPKAGGPFYLRRFVVSSAPKFAEKPKRDLNLASLCKDLKTVEKPHKISQILPGPTGELNQLSTFARHPILCLGPGKQAVAAQVEAVERRGGVAVGILERLGENALKDLPQFGGLLWWGDRDQARLYAKALAELEGPIIPLITDLPDSAHALQEQHLCVDTTAAGGNVSLLAGICERL